MTESREHWSSWDSLYTLSEDTLGEEMEAWETFQFSSLENWSDSEQPHTEVPQCSGCQVSQVTLSTENRLISKQSINGSYLNIKPSAVYLALQPTKA